MALQDHLVSLPRTYVSITFGFLRHGVGDAHSVPQSNVRLGMCDVRAERGVSY
jgi:hypothetical protein